MARNHSWLKEALIIGAILVAVVLSLPLLGAMAFVTRAAFLVAVVGALVGGSVLFALSPQFREWLNAHTEPALAHKGLRMDAAVSLDRSHAWARIDADEALIGADDLLQATLGPVDAVELPAMGTRVRRGEQLFVLRRGARDVTVRSPVSGTVMSTNTDLRDRPTLVNEEPFGKGWAVRLRGKDLSAEREQLLRGKRAREWFREEVDRLIALLLAEHSLEPAVADGGVLVEGLYQHVDDAAWKRLQSGFFAASEQAEPRA
ncbi:MAG: hypothetical protein JSV80_03170 [Acidobacteriota bacterium]|nr:MAG: hypothetical protein JSV80_03170 [Acidobacteriota bacterium]